MDGYLQSAQQQLEGGETSKNDYEAISQLVGVTQESLKKSEEMLELVTASLGDVKKLSDVVKRQNEDIQQQREMVRSTQIIVVTGFVLAILAVISILLTNWGFMQTSMKQVTDQTQLLQSLNDKVK